MSNTYTEWKSIIDGYINLWYNEKKTEEARMELRELRYFLAVAQEKSITKAAEYLYIAQPSLSKQMQNLEKEIGRPLFIRGSRTITLTETGQLLKKRAEEMLDLYEKTEAEIAAPPGEVRGEVRIGGGESFALQSVAKAARAVQRDYPRIRFNFFSGDAEDVIEKLDKGLIDFGILIDLADLSRYNTLRLPDCDVWGVLLRKDDALAQKESVTAEDLQNVPLICSRQSMRKMSLPAWFGGDMEHLHIRAVYNLIYNATLLVRAGMGCAITIDKLINTSGDSDLCFRPLSPTLETHLDMAWKKHAVFSRPAQIFLEYLQEDAKNGKRTEKTGTQAP